MLWESILIAFISYLGWIATPWLGGQSIGWYVFGRPLIAGTIVGFILGDVQTGMIVGATINAIYIGAITPGGAMAADMNFAGYIASALALMTSVKPEVAVALAVPLGLIGTFTWQFFATVNTFFAHAADGYAKRAEIGKFTFMLIGAPQIVAFIIRFIPAFLVLYYGAPIAKDVLSYIPDWFTHMLTVIGGMLPALGMAILLKMLVRKKSMLAYFIIGFLAVAALKFTILSVALVGGALAMISFQFKEREGEVNV